LPRNNPPFFRARKPRAARTCGNGREFIDTRGSDVQWQTAIFEEKIVAGKYSRDAQHPPPAEPGAIKAASAMLTTNSVSPSLGWHGLLASHVELT
jgi:hypothetical protein